MYVCMTYVRMYAHTHTHTHIYACMHTALSYLLHSTSKDQMSLPTLITVTKRLFAKTRLDLIDGIQNVVSPSVRCSFQETLL